MSIFAYVGMPGSGKTYDVVANQIMPALKGGRLVVTNIPLHEDVIREAVPDAKLSSFPTEQIAQSPELLDQYALPGCVLVLDEVWRIWPAGQKSNQVPEPFRKLLAEHRHMVDEDGNSMQIVLVTQDLAQIGAFARLLVEQTFYHTKLTHVGAAGSYRIDVYQGPQQGANPPRGSRLREIFGRYDKAVFAFYKSHTMSKSDKSGANEKSVDARGNIWRRPMLWWSAAACVAFLFWAVPAAKDLIHNPTGRELPAASGATGRQSSPIVAAPGTARQAHASTGPAWRVAGTIMNSEPGQSRAYLTNGSVTVSVFYDANCQRQAEGWTVCQWQGQEVTEWSAPPPAAAPRADVVPET